MVILDLRKLSSIADYFVIATGNNAPHIKTLIRETERTLKEKHNINCYRESGRSESEWVVADYVDVVLQVFSPKSRDYYSLELFWNDAPRISP